MLRSTNANLTNQTSLNSPSLEPLMPFVETNTEKNKRRRNYCILTIIYLGSSCMTFYLGKVIGELSCDGSI